MYKGLANGHQEAYVIRGLEQLWSESEAVVIFTRYHTGGLLEHFNGRAGLRSLIVLIYRVSVMAMS